MMKWNIELILDRKYFYEFYLVGNSILLANIFSFDIQDSTQYIHRTS